MGMAEIRNPKRRRTVPVPPQALTADAAEERRFHKWISSYAAVSKWMAQYDLESLLDKGGGFAWLPQLLPDFVAEGFLRRLECLQEWNDTAAYEDYSQNNISHAFWSSKQGPGLEPLFRAMSMLSPNSLHTFSAGKYTSGHGHIAPHDDRAYTQVLMETGQQITCSRTIAVIYYLTKDWQSDYGGHLVDLACTPPQRYVPAFNAAVCFRIPRFHEVTPVTTHRPRFSIFGWFLAPGKLYDLHTPASPSKLQQRNPQQTPQQPHKHRQQPSTVSSKPRAKDRQTAQDVSKVRRQRLKYPVHMRLAPPAPSSSAASSARLRGPVELLQD